MAMTIVEMTRPVTGGVDTHADVHFAAAVDATGGVLGVEMFATTPRGYAELADWLSEPPRDSWRLRLSERMESWGDTVRRRIRRSCAIRRCV